MKEPALMVMNIKKWPGLYRKYQEDSPSYLKVLGYASIMGIVLSGVVFVVRTLLIS